MITVKYTYSYEIVRESGSVESGCGAISFINLGTDVATILGYPLQQNQGYEPPNQFAGGYDETNYTVSFKGVTQDQQLLVIRQKYKDATI